MNGEISALERAAQALTSTLRHHGIEMHPDDIRGLVADVIAEIRTPIVAALKPFADCAAELDGNEDVPRAPEGEWAKFRLLTDDYRRARDAVAMIGPLVAEGQ